MWWKACLSPMAGAGQRSTRPPIEGYAFGKRAEPWLNLVGIAVLLSAAERGKAAKETMTF